MMLRARRLVVAFAGLMLLSLLSLGGRVAWVQVALHGSASTRSDRQSLRDEVLPARRGALRDRYGRILATAEETLQVAVWPPNLARRCADEQELATRVWALAGFLSPLVQAAPEELARRMRDDGNRVLGRPVRSPEIMQRLHAARTSLLADVDLLPGWARRYPWGSVAGNLLGYVSHEGRGVAGLEQGLDATLAGRPGGRQRRVDPLGREIAEAGLVQQAPVHGRDVTLTIDVRMQQMVEEELLRVLHEQAAGRAVGVVLDPRSGEILCLASVPGLDVDDPTRRPRDESVMAAVQEIYPPGSSFKPLMMATALELGLAHPSEPPLDCSAFDGRPIRDSHPQGRPLTLEEILIHSSNIGMAKILTRIVPAHQPRNTALMKPVHDVLMQLGLGRPTDVPLPAEAGGRVTPLPEWIRNYTLASISFGQELGVTALQMAAATSSLADGLYRVPRLVRDPAPGEWPAPRAVFSAAVSRRVRGWMASAVEQGHTAEVKIPGLPVAGKTGTAQSETDRSREIHSYVALVPADDPVLTLVVVVRDPRHARYSSQSAAPAAGRILRRLLPYLGHPIEGRDV